MSEPLPTPEQLSRFLAGASPPAEEETVRRWLADRVERRVDIEAALRGSKGRIAAPPRPFSPRFVAAAAAAVVIMVAGTIIARRPATGPEMVTHATAVGARDTVRLADGSRVILGPASSIVVAGREVQLRGEAFFEVVHDARRPFVVYAGNTTIRDVGTAFGVASDSGAPVRVVVTEGIVEVRHGADSVILNRGDVARVDSSGVIETLRSAATPEDLAWLSGRLVFRNAPVEQVVADLRRWYGVELRVTDSTLLRRHFTGVFAGDPVDRVLEVLALALGADVTRDEGGRVVRLSPAATSR